MDEELRRPSAGFQTGIDALFDGLLEELRIPHHRLDATHRDGWVDEVLTAVDQPLRPAPDGHRQGDG